MTTDVDICNRALASIGTRSTIANLNEGSTEARNCRLIYHTTLDGLLRAAHWNFARRTDYLTMLKALPGTPENPGPAPNNGLWNPRTMPPPPWVYSYAVPSDCVKMRSIQPQTQTATSSGIQLFSTMPADIPPPLNWQNRGVRFIECLDNDTAGNMVKVVCTNQEMAIGVYTIRIDNPSLWDSLFESAMIGSLGWRLAIPLSGDKTLAKMAHDTAVEAILAARIADGNEGTMNVNRIPDWIAVRGFAGDWSTTDGAYMNGWNNPSFLGL